MHRLPARASYDKHVVHGILDEALVCTISYVDAQGAPVTIPTNFVRCGEDVLVHGKANAGYLTAAASGAQVCCTVTLLDGLVLARSAFHHSMNYRSVVLFGTGQLVRFVHRVGPFLGTTSLRVVMFPLRPTPLASTRIPGPATQKRSLRH